jgi:DUF4097 and DUF4098 domain-containing protein YvlB
MRNLQTLAVLAALIATPMTARTVVIHPTKPTPAIETINFALQNGGKLKVATVNGTIKISAWDKDEVDMTANFKPSSDDQHVSLEIDSKNNSLELIVKHPKNKSRLFGPRRSAVCDIELKVPRRVISNISTVNGKIELDSIVGRTKASAVNGTIFLGGISGDIDADTVNGSISGAVQNIEKMLDCSTVNGSIDVKLLNPDGALNISTVNGKINIKTPGAKDFEINKRSARATFGDGSAKMKFSTVNGSVSVQ